MVVEDLQQIVPDLKHVSRKKILLVWGSVTAGLLLLSLALAVVVGVLSYRGASGSGGVGQAQGLSSGNPKLCSSPGCLEAASWQLQAMDTSVSPCEDFYQYSCGSWIHQHTLSPDQESSTVLQDLQTTNKQLHWMLIEAPVSRPAPQSYERKLKDFFSLCKDEYGKMKAGGEQLVDALRSTLGGCYVLDPDRWADHWDLSQALASTHSKLLVPALYMYHVVPHPRIRNKNIISITDLDMLIDPVLTLHPVTDQQKTAYESFQRSAVSLLLRDAGLTLTDQEKDTRIDQFITDVHQMEQQVLQIHHTVGLLSYSTEDSGELITLAQLQHNLTQVDWVTIFSQIFGEAGVGADTEVLVRSVTYLQQLDSLLRGMDSNEAQRVLNNYLVWQVLNVYSEFLSWEYRHMRYQYLEALTGSTSPSSMWENCMHITKFHMAPALVALYAQKHIGEEGKTQVDEIFKYLRTALTHQVDRFSWMDDQTKTLARTKVEGMKDLLGYPSVLTDENKMDNMFAKLKVNTSDSFLQNLLYSNEFMTSQLNAELQGKVGLGLWEYVLLMPDFGTWIHYFWVQNIALVPPGISQFPFFNSASPASLNFGGLGSMIAEEIVHAVDEAGSIIYNETFQLWWSNATKVQFEEAKQCVLDKYNKKEVGPFLVDGENKTVMVQADHQVWNIMARTAGVAIAYDAYMDWMSSKGTEGSLPGIDMTNAQLFFLSTAQTRCSTQREKAAYQWAQYGFLPDKFLINDILGQQEAFADAFNCSPGQKLVPEKRCPVF